jgi:serine/threonine protein kinase
MGEVYRAIDHNLKRQVALKVLAAPVADDPDRLARFQREAELLAALNHPHIAHVHGLEKSAGTTALVMDRSRSMKPSRSRGRSRRRSKPRMNKESFIAISSLPTSKSALIAP